MREGLRFCFLTTFYPPWNFGGDGIAVRRLAAALGRRGHHVTVVHDVDAYRFLAGGDPKGALAPPKDEGVEVISLESRLGRLSPLLAHQTGRPVVTGGRIRRILAEGDFDVIHYHNVSLVGGPKILAYGDALKVYSAHEHWLVCPTHVLWRHGREPCTGRECVRCVLRQRRPPQIWRWTGSLDRALDHVDVFLAMSEFSRRKHQEFGFPRDMEVLPCFLPDLDEDASHGPPPRHRPYFLFAGRLERIKGLDDVIPLFQGPGEADLLIAGEGPDGPRLRRLAEGSDRIGFVGHLERPALDACFRHATAVIVPSVGFETFGMTIIEGFRHGTPVFARRTGPFPEIVESSRGGELFGTADELGRALDRIRRDPAWRCSMSRAARKAFREHYSEESVVPRYLEIVRKAGEERGRRKPMGRLAQNPLPASTG